MQRTLEDSARIAAERFFRISRQALRGKFRALYPEDRDEADRLAQLALILLTIRIKVSMAHHRNPFPTEDALFDHLDRVSDAAVTVAQVMKEEVEQDAREKSAIEVEVPPRGG